MNGARWYFMEQPLYAPERFPQEAEFFKFDDPSVVVVREAGQNSLDARADNQRLLTMCFTLGSVQKDDIQKYLDGLLDHIRGSGYMPENFDGLSRVSFLTIEDFGTTGLDGEVRRERCFGKKSNFVDFWWREGISYKSGREAGKWGVGKTSFYSASQLRTLFGVTIRKDDGRELLMGKCLLKPHPVGGVMYDYYGYYKGGEGDEPIEDKEIIRQFKKNFSITRTTEPGLSIVILMPLEEITYEGIVRAVIEQFFYPILRGAFEVKISKVKDSALKKQITVNAETIEQIAPSVMTERHTVMQDPSGSLQFVREAVSGNGEVIVLEGAGNNLKLTENSFNGKLDELRDRFLGGQMLHFRIPVEIERRTPAGGAVFRSSLRTFFDVFLRRYPELDRAEEFYVRSGILIPEIKKVGKHPVRALFVAEHEVIAEFLKDAETPAHVKWEARTGDFKKKYPRGPTILQFIVESMGKIVSVLDQLPREQLQNLLIDIFYVPEEEEGGKEIGPPRKPPGPKTTPAFQLDQVAGTGFRVSLVEGVNTPLEGEVEAAYAIWRGDPFRKYHPADFDLADETFAKECRGGKIVSCEKNRIRFVAEREDFELKVTGFDPKRDLKIRVKKIWPQP